MNVSTHKSVGNFGKNLVQHLALVKNNWLLKNMPKYCWVRAAISTWNISRLRNTAKKWLQ